MKKILVLTICLAWQQYAKAQHKLEFNKMGLKVAYLTSVTLPGFKLGVEVPTHIFKSKKYRSKEGMATTRERYWTLNLGFYNHPNFHNNLYLLVERQIRRQYKRGFFMDIAPGLGYSRTILDNATYALSADGNSVSKKTFVGYNYLMLSGAGSLGYDFSKTKKIPLKIYAKASVFVLMPYNSSIYIRPTYEIGAILPLTTFKKK